MRLLWRCNWIWPWMPTAAAVFLILSFLPLARYEDGKSFNLWTGWELVFAGGAIVGNSVDTAIALTNVAIQFGLFAMVSGCAAQIVVFSVGWSMRGGPKVFVRRVCEWKKKPRAAQPKQMAPARQPESNFSTLPKFPT